MIGCEYSFGMLKGACGWGVGVKTFVFLETKNRLFERE